MASSKKAASKEKQEADPLVFSYFPAFAEFILNNKLDEYTRTQLQYSREEKVPLLKYFTHLSDDEFLEMGRVSGTELMQVFMNNTARAYLEKSTANYKKNLIPSIEREQVAAEDITLISFVRRKTLRKFLMMYTQDMELYNNVMDEIDHFITVSETLTFNAYLEVQQAKISQINSELEVRQEELLEAQELTSMGSFYWDMKEGKSVYTPGVMKIFDMRHPGKMEEFMEFVHEEDRDKLQAAINNALKGDGIYDCEYRYLRGKKEKRIWSRGKVKFADNVPISMKGTIMDVTNKYEMLGQLQESEALNKLSQAITHIGNWTWEIESGKVLWSDEMYRIYGLAPQSEEITFDRFLSLIHPDDRGNRVAEINESLKTGEAKDYILRIVNPDGKQKILRGKGEVVMNHKHQPVKIVGTCQDVTKEHSLNQELHNKSTLLEKLNSSLEIKNDELERINKELESFNYVASHDLQEPLRKIRTFTNRILDRGLQSLPPGTADYFDKIMISSARMQNLIEDLLTFSQTSTHEKSFEFTDLNRIIEDVLNTLSQAVEEKQAHIKSNGLPVIKIVPFQFQQLFLNLIGNAIKYSKPGTPPVVSISSEHIKGDSIKKGIAGQQYVVIHFEDNGIGFEQEYAEKIFGLFQRLHNKDTYSGTGIGLAICKKILHNHNGFIEAVSKPGKGSVFSIYVPQEEAPETFSRPLMN